MGLYFILVILLLVICALAIRDTGTHITSDELPEPKLDAFFSTLPAETDPIYQDAHHLYRHHDSFIYTSPSQPSTLLKVYPLCCVTCKRSAHQEIAKARCVEALRSQAPIRVAPHRAIRLAPGPPPHQGQAQDTTRYVVMHVDRVEQPHVDIRDLTLGDLRGLIQTLALIPERYGWKIKDVSISNLGRLGGVYCVQHLDDCSPVSSAERSGADSLNLLYNRYNILKHLPAESFADPAHYAQYQRAIPLISGSHNHLLDLPRILEALRDPAAS
jgi:hypothetical protein